MKKETVYTALTAVFVMAACLFCSVWLQGITKDIFSVPLCTMSDGDEAQFLVWGKNLIETGTIEKSGRLGAPFEANFSDFPLVFTMRFDFIILRLLAFIFSTDIFIALSLHYVVLPTLTGLTAFLGLRQIKIARWISAGGAIIFAFLPFYFQRNIGHWGLTTYEFVPLTFLLCVWGYRQQMFFPLKKDVFLKKPLNWAALLFCILIANNGSGYWASFSCFFLLLTAIFAVIDTKKRITAMPCLVAFGIIVTSFLLSISPYIVYWAENGKNPMVGQRVVWEPEMYGLKIAQMMIPYEIPGNTGWERKIKKYHDSAPLVNENRTAYLGLAGTIGFCVLLIRAFGLQLAGKSRLINLFARLNLAGTLLALIGGMATVFSVVLGGGLMLRGYNRISVFLGFLAIATVCWMIDRQWRQTKGMKRQYVIAGAVVLFAAHFVLLYPLVHHRPDFGALQTMYQTTRKFFMDVEATLPAGAMVYQMPYHPFPEKGPVNKMGDYALFIGFLCSDTLRWSYGGMYGRGGDAWHARVAALPLKQRLQVLSLVGFAGIYIDRRAYTPEEMTVLDQALRNYLQEEAQISKDKNLCFYPMRKFNDDYLAQYTEAEKEKYRKELLREVFISEQHGISHIEKNEQGTWQWMDRKATLKIVNQGEAYDQTLEFMIAAPASETAFLVIDVNGERHEYKIGRKPVKISLPVHIQHGENSVSLTTDANKINAPKDTRSMYMRFVNSDITAFFPQVILMREGN